MSRNTDNPGHVQPGRSRGGHGRFVRAVETAERDAAACRLRTDGRTYQQIADDLGFTDPSAARKSVERALAAVVAEPAGRLRTIELARLDAATAKAFDVLNRDHIVVNNGRVIMDPATGRPLRDDGPTLAAIDRIVRLSERRARLCGLDAAVKVEAITVDQVEAEIARLAAELGMNDTAEEVR